MQAYRASGPMLLIIPFLHINTLSLLFVYLMAWDECMVTWPAQKHRARHLAFAYCHDSVSEHCFVSHVRRNLYSERRISPSPSIEVNSNRRECPTVLGEISSRDWSG